MKCLKERCVFVLKHKIKKRRAGLQGKKESFYDLVTTRYLSLLLSALISWSHSCPVNRAAEDRLFSGASRFSQNQEERKCNSHLCSLWACLFVWIFHAVLKRSSCTPLSLLGYGDTKFRAVISMDCRFLLCIDISFIKAYKCGSLSISYV